jgi:uncharacterized coiled-coil DUF342 family protein
MSSADQQPGEQRDAPADLLRCIIDDLKSERDAASKRWREFGESREEVRQQLRRLRIGLGVLVLFIFLMTMATWIVLSRRG